MVTAIVVWFRLLQSSSFYIGWHEGLKLHSEGSLWAIPCENTSSDKSGQWRPRSACASAQSDLGLHCLSTQPVSAQSDQGLYWSLKQSLNTIKCMNGEQRPERYLCACEEWCDYAHFAHVQRHVFACRSPYSEGPYIIGVLSFDRSIQYDLCISSYLSVTSIFYFSLSLTQHRYSIKSAFS